MKKILSILLFLLTINPIYAASVRFVQLTDIHYTSSGETKSNRDLSQSSKALKLAIRSINNQNDIDFIIFLGDNIDKSLPKDLIEFMKTINCLNKPYYVILGNHDAHKASGIPKADYAKVIGLFNEKQKKGYTTYSFKIDKNITGIVLDGVVPFSPSAHGIFDDKTLKWLDKKLKKLEKNNKKAMIFQHFPLMEPYKNPSHEIMYKDKYYKILKKHKNVISISSGHFHDSRIQDEEISENNVIKHISCPSLAAPPHFYQIVTVNYDKKFKKPAQNIKIDVKEIDLQ